MKRLLDIILAGIALAVLGIPRLVVALLVRLTSPRSRRRERSLPII